jgi:hypothetical protein
MVLKTAKNHWRKVSLLDIVLGVEYINKYYGS